MRAGRRILVVDGDALGLELVTDVLEGAGFDVLCAETLVAAIEMARAEQPALVLLDAALSGQMDGLRATRELRADARTAHIPVVVMTANAMVGNEEKAREAGAAAYLTKPIDVKLLPTLVANVIAGARA
jgi:CheY-like chemotaxis protein